MSVRPERVRWEPRWNFSKSRCFDELHRMRHQEGNDRLDQILPSTHHVAEQVLLVIVVSPGGDYATHIEEIPKLVKDTRRSLRPARHRELVRHLLAGLVAFSTDPTFLSDEADGEASLSVY